MWSGRNQAPCTSDLMSRWSLLELLIRWEDEAIPSACPEGDNLVIISVSDELRLWRETREAL